MRTLIILLVIWGSHQEPSQPSPEGSSSLSIGPSVDTKKELEQILNISQHFVETNQVRALPSISPKDIEVKLMQNLIQIQSEFELGSTKRDLAKLVGYFTSKKNSLEEEKFKFKKKIREIIN